MNFLKDELENERRKSTADQNRIRKFEEILQQKQRALDEAENEFLRRDSNIRDLEQALAEERRKSMLDEGRIKQLEGELQRRVQEAGENYKNMMAAQRKSELTLEEIEKLKAEMERERR